MNTVSRSKKLTIVEEIKRTKYYSILVDSTLHDSSVDQLKFVIRYISSDGTPNEHFLTFLPNCGHKSEEVAESVSSHVTFLRMNLSNCRGQSYDNARYMSGCHKGVQSKIKKLSPYVTYVPCAGHYLQLVGSVVAESSADSITFLSIEQKLYNSFRLSRKRWDVLLSHYR